MVGILVEEDMRWIGMEGCSGRWIEEGMAWSGSCFGIVCSEADTRYSEMDMAVVGIIAGIVGEDMLAVDNWSVVAEKHSVGRIAVTNR